MQQRNVEREPDASKQIRNIGQENGHVAGPTIVDGFPDIGTYEQGSVMESVGVIGPRTYIWPGEIGPRTDGFGAAHRLGSSGPPNERSPGKELIVTSAQGNRRHVIIAGGGFGGLGAAFHLRRRLSEDDRITVISPTGQFFFEPSLIGYALGRADLHTSFPFQPALESKGIEYIRNHVRGVNTETATVSTDAGELRFDRLLIATGGRPNPQAVPGLAGEFRHSHFIVGLDSAGEVRNVIRRLIESPGPVVIGSAQRATYLSVFYELALGIDFEIRRAGKERRHADQDGQETPTDPLVSASSWPTGQRLPPAGFALTAAEAGHAGGSFLGSMFTIQPRHHPRLDCTELCPVAVR